MISPQKCLSLRAFVTAVLLLACFCFGGSASISVYEMGLSIFALVCMLVVLWFCASPKISGPINWFIPAGALLAVFQLVPLPYVAWHSMPQADFAESLLPNSQLRGMWTSLSIAPDDTLYSVIAATPALIILWLAACLTQSEKIFITNILILAVLFEAIIGIFQAAGALSYVLYNFRHENVAIGLFASRNHFADAILLGTSMLFGIRRSWRDRFGTLFSEFILHSIIAIFALAIIGSASRSGIILFVIVSIIGYALSINTKNRIALTAVLSVIGVGFWAISRMFAYTGILKTVAERFELVKDARWEIWMNTQIASREYQPWGAGLGAFSKAYEESEQLQSVVPMFINAAHNEFYQMQLETGILGIAIAFISFVQMAILTASGFRGFFQKYSMLGIIIILLHSIVDYPFRVISINVFFTCLIGFAFPSKERST